MVTQNTGKNWWADFTYKNGQFVLKRNSFVMDATTNDAEA